MFPDFYTIREYQKELLRQAKQHRLAKEAQTDSVQQRVGHSLMNLGVRLAANTPGECYTTTVHDQVVTVCPAGMQPA